MYQRIGFWISKCRKPAQGQKQRFWTSNCTKPAQGQKDKSFELRSPSNLHKDKQKTLQRYSPQFPSRSYFFIFYCRCAGFVHFEVQNLCSFCPCAGLAHFKLKPVLFLCLWRFILIRKSPTKALRQGTRRIKSYESRFKEGEWSPFWKNLIKRNSLIKKVEHLYEEVLKNLVQ